MILQSSTKQLLAWRRKLRETHQTIRRVRKTQRESYGRRSADHKASVFIRQDDGIDITISMQRTLFILASTRDSISKIFIVSINALLICLYCQLDNFSTDHCNYFRDYNWKFELLLNIQHYYIETEPNAVQHWIHDIAVVIKFKFKFWVLCDHDDGTSCLALRFVKTGLQRPRSDRWTREAYRKLPAGITLRCTANV